MKTKILNIDRVISQDGLDDVCTSLFLRGINIIWGW